MKDTEMKCSGSEGGYDSMAIVQWSLLGWTIYKNKMKRTRALCVFVKVNQWASSLCRYTYEFPCVNHENVHYVEWSDLSQIVLLPEICVRAAFYGAFPAACFSLETSSTAFVSASLVPFWAGNNGKVCALCEKSVVHWVNSKVYYWEQSEFIWGK